MFSQIGTGVFKSEVLRNLSQVPTHAPLDEESCRSGRWGALKRFCDFNSCGNIDGQSYGS